MNRGDIPPRECMGDLERRCRGYKQLLALLASATLVIGLATLLQLAPANAAKSYPDRSAADAGAAMGDPTTNPADSLQTTESSTYTLWLPYIVDGYRLVDGPFGVQIWGANSTAIDRMTEIGTRWVRLPLSWCWIEPENTTPENYTWSASFEQQLAALSAAHIRVILQFGDNPSWAATYLNGPIDLVEIGQVTEFMQAVVARYSQPPYNVKYWEIYNEPDNGSVLFAEQGLGYFGYTPEAYVDILEAVYQPVKAIDPGAKILLGGLAYDVWPQFVENFLDQVLLNGGADSFDLMNFHYYAAFRANWEQYGHGILGKLAYLRDKLAYYGVDKPIFCTETGWFSNFQGDDGHEIQSRYLVQTFVGSMTADLGAVIWFTLADSVNDYREWGLVDINLDPKPSYYAHQTLTAQMFGAEYVRTLGLGDTGSDQIEAYEFATRTGCTIVVAWSNDLVTVTHELEIQTSQLVVVDMFGTEATVYDGDDGVVDGRVHVPIGVNPVYLRRACGTWK